jgi:23S rRNA pseudouridine955/2504/2580 synthase
MTVDNPEIQGEFDKNDLFRTVEPDEDGLRLDRWFRRHFPALTHGQLQKWLRKGQIRLDGKRVDSSERVQDGQKIRLPAILVKDEKFTASPPRTGRPMRDPAQLKSLVLYEDADVVALNKPAGLAVQGGTGLKENLDDSLMVFSPDGVTRPKLVHRLDRETSGVLLIARNDYAAAKLAASFRMRSTQKVYWAIICGVPKPLEGEISVPLVKRGQIMEVAAPRDPESKKATTLYKVVENAARKVAFVALWPLTGRTHQLRVHLAHIGVPILGDPIYNKGIVEGLPSQELGKRLHLHARRLIIPHPRGGTIDVSAPLDAQMCLTWQWFGFSETVEVSFDDLL